MLIFRDQCDIGRPKLYKDAENLLEDIFASQAAPSRVGLRTQIRATHSGYLLNSRVYPGVFMRDSVGSWCSPERGGTSPFDKPVILDHADDQANQVIGRVRGATFVQSKYGDSFKYDYKNPSQGSNHGSGHIILDTMITDPDAIVRIIDGRYNTVSTGQRPSAARCSVCGYDWLDQRDADPCEHRPGRLYQFDDTTVPCYLVTGTLDFRECSYVTVPAQPNAVTLSSNLEALEGIRAQDTEDEETVYTTMNGVAQSLSFDLCDSEGNILDLILRDGVEDILPDIATKFTKIAVSVPVEDENMKKDKSEDKSKKTTDEADTILDSWVEDHDKKCTKEASPEVKEDDETKDKDDPEKTVVDEPEDTQLEDKVEKDKPNVSNKALGEALDTVTGERDTLKIEVEELTKQLDEKTEVITSLTGELSSKRQHSVVDAARQLALMRVVTGHASAEGAGSSSELFDEYVTSLCERSEDSLNDAIRDEFPNLAGYIGKNRNTNTRTVRDVEDPTLNKDEDKPDEQGEDDGNGKNENKLVDKTDYLDNI